MRRQAGSREGIELDDGTLVPADLVLVGIGVEASTDLAHQLGLQTRHGIKVDTSGATAIDGVYAVGDVAEQWSRCHDRWMRLENWANAQNQAIATARRTWRAKPRSTKRRPGSGPINMIATPDRWTIPAAAMRSSGATSPAAASPRSVSAMARSSAHRRQRRARHVGSAPSRRVAKGDPPKRPRKSRFELKRALAS